MKKILFTLLLSFFFAPVWADVSPKPEMEFNFIYETAQPVPLDPLHSEQLQCKDNQCFESEPLGVYGLQKLYCTASDCFSVAYEYEPFQKLILTFANGKKLESNVFAAPDTLRARFDVRVTENGLTVTPAEAPADTASWVRRDAWVSLILILVLELLAATAYLLYTQKSFVILYSVVLANLITTAVSWLFLARYVKETAFLWIFCLLAETLIIRLLNRKRLPLYDSFMLSLATNVTSYSLGIMLSFLLAPLIF